MPQHNNVNNVSLFSHELVSGQQNVHLIYMIMFKSLRVLQTKLNNIIDYKIESLSIF